MFNLVYQIDSVTDRNGDEKEIPAEWKIKQYSLDAVAVGRSAWLGWVDSDNKGLQTSTVEEIFIYGNSVRITTQNTVYWMKPTI